MCKSMNRAEMKALLMIVKKLSWNDKPALQVIEAITQMVRNQQALELDTVGECDDFEETLLTMATWSSERIFSTQFVSDYQSLCDYSQNFRGLLFLEDMGLGSYTDVGIMMAYAEQSAEILAPGYEAEDIAYEEYLNEYYSDYDAEMLRETMWITEHC